MGRCIVLRHIKANSVLMRGSGSACVIERCSACTAASILSSKGSEYLLLARFRHFRTLRSVSCATGRWLHYLLGAGTLAHKTTLRFVNQFVNWPPNVSIHALFLKFHPNFGSSSPNGREAAPSEQERPWFEFQAGSEARDARVRSWKWEREGTIEGLSLQDGDAEYTRC